MCFFPSSSVGLLLKTVVLVPFRESSGPSEQLAPVATVGEVSSASVPEGVREPPSQRAPHFLLDQSPPSTFGSPGMTTGHQQGLERGVAPQQNSRALCSTPPELLQLIQVKLLLNKLVRHKGVKVFSLFMECSEDLLSDIDYK